ncbi:putative hydrolase or acyltransferase of alpha/beta superfamily [Beggiatoa alba B18LD]|uniref:Putative hydrolase or acyltransferase of alpha/beta superfamily n=1 Tax=Beggiatoa alba B18LD TaxID=395493 RepID=I3CJ36_9GAMM|nr:alpha/beta hydrolase [Beggiatoa alba]EIJ43629.1 putative hydrolase or acyltransferase of alpha/beta superfamily [Beggiatoa alba B18LD]
MRNQHYFRLFFIPFIWAVGLNATMINVQATQPTELKGLTMSGQLVTVGEHRLYIHCEGEGSPVVLMDAGLGGTSMDWSRIQPAIANYTKVCTYDRAGYGWSEAGEFPRTSSVIADELYTLVKNAGIAPPYIVVGHSFGGFNVRLFAHRHPTETVGMVLVDASHEKQFKRFTQEAKHNLTPTMGAQFTFLSRPNIPDNLPENKQALAKRLVSTERTYASLVSEVTAMRSSAQTVSDESDIHVPLVVLTRGIQAWKDNPRSAQLEAVWQTLQTELATQSPYSAHMVVQGSGHYIHLDKPQVVIESINSLVAIHRHERDLRTELARLSARWDTSNLTMR